MRITLIALLIQLSCWAVSTAVEFRYAQNIEIETHPGYRLITVKNAQQESAQSYQYALISKGAPKPKDLPPCIIIRTPVTRAVAMETVYIGYLAALNQLESLVGAGTTQFITHPKVRSAVASGRIKRVQIGQSLDIESMLMLRPDLILTSLSGNPAYDVPAQLQRSGLPVVLSAGYMESHPLARSEWIKFVAAFYEQDVEAEALFRKIETRYLELANMASNQSRRPVVFTGAPYSGVWHIAGGRSYTAQSIKDAGGDYIWADDPRSGSFPLDPEVILLHAGNADIWLNPSHYRSMAELFNADPRFGSFAAASNNQVYNNSKRATDSGGNDIWESGIMQPDEVLNDLIQILHPELFPDREFVYYEHLN